MEIKNSNVLNLLNVIAALEPQGERQQTPVSPFKFCAKTRFALAYNLRQLTLAQDTILATRKSLIAEHAMTIKDLGNGQATLTNTDPAKTEQFSKALGELMDATSPVTLKTIQAHELDLDTNQIRTDLLMLLMDTVLIEDEEKTPKTRPKLAAADRLDFND